MKIDKLDVWVINVPNTQAFTSSFETKPGETRTLVRLCTDTGVVGWGETMWGSPVAKIIENLRDDIIGTDPADTEAFRTSHRMLPFFYGYLAYAAMAAIDVACWDIIGHAAGLPVRSMIGGSVRDTVPLTGLITRAQGTADDYPHSLADAAEQVVGEFGFTAVKLKGSTDAYADLAIMRALRDRLPDVELRVDPNGAWNVPDSIRVGRALESLHLEYLEDPCDGQEQMARVAEAVDIPLCTNMCVVRWDDLAPAVRLNSAQVIHGDVFKWGSIATTKNLAAFCEAFGLGMNMHSGGELGIATAAHLAVVGSTPILSRAIDSMYYLHADDVVEKLELANGALSVPDGPGLGVTVDVDKVYHYAEKHAAEGDYTL